MPSCDILPSTNNSSVKISSCSSLNVSILNGRQIVKPIKLIKSVQCPRTEKPSVHQRLNDSLVHSISSLDSLRPREREIKLKSSNLSLSPTDARLLENFLTCDPTDSSFWMDFTDQ